MLPRSVVTLAALVLSVGGAGCDSGVPDKSTINGWPPGEPLTAGFCEFLLTKATLYHSDAWHLEVEVSAANTEVKGRTCGFSARAVSASGEVLTEAAAYSAKVTPGATWIHTARAREANRTGLSNGRTDGVWIYLEASDGSWPMAETTGVYVNPEFLRPPDD